jgi:hypothetical protein
MRVKLVGIAIFGLILAACDFGEPDCAKGTHQEGCVCVRNCAGNQAIIKFTNNLTVPMSASLLSGNSFVFTTPALQPGESTRDYSFNVPNGSFAFHTGFRENPCSNQRFGCQWMCSYPLETRACGVYTVTCP